MDSWREVWRKGFAPQFSDESLEVLREGLLNNDVELIQGSTTIPPPLFAIRDWLVEASCPISYCGWKGRNLETVGEVEEFFAKSCYRANMKLEEPAACRHFLNWWDDAPRSEAIHDLLNEVQLEISRRSSNGILTQI